jgi:hypothetical protein
VDLAELCGEHRLLEQQVNQLLRAASAPTPDPASVAGLRWRMAQTLSDHRAGEDRLVYDRLLSCGDSIATAVAWRHRQEFNALTRAFGDYIAAWPVDRIAREWEQFGLETEAVASRLAAQILVEEQVLYTHALRVEARRAAA